MTTPSRPLLPFAACAIGVATFSVMDALMKGLSIAMGAYNALLWRGIAGLLVGGVAMLVTRTPWPSPAMLRLHGLRGAVVAFMALSFFWALARMPMAEAIALSFVAPIAALFLAGPMLGEPIRREGLFASLLGLSGVIVILAAELGREPAGRAVSGIAAVLVSALLYAWNLLLQRRQAQVSSPVEIGFFQNLVILLVMACAAPFAAVLPPAGAAGAIAGAALLAFVSLLFLSWGYARAEAQRLIPLEYSAFLWSALTGWLVFGEPLRWPTVGGAALIVAGCVLAARAGPHGAEPVEAAAL